MPADINQSFSEAVLVSSPEEEEAFIEMERRLNPRPAPTQVQSMTYEEGLLVYRTAHPDHTHRSFKNR